MCMHIHTQILVFTAMFSRNLVHSDPYVPFLPLYSNKRGFEVLFEVDHRM